MNDLDDVINAFLRGLKQIQLLWLSKLKQNPTPAGLTLTARNLVRLIYGKETLEKIIKNGYELSWISTGDELLKQLGEETSLIGKVPVYSTPSPISLPKAYRTYAETHLADRHIARASWEWITEHEATLNKTLPQSFIDRYVQHRVPPLVNVVDEQLLKATNTISAGIAERGFSNKEAIQALEVQFPEFTNHRLENIARTEGAVLYETGRLARYREDSLIKGFEFVAIVDSRTTSICDSYDGLKFKLDDESHPTPPLHYQCRSTISPIVFTEDVEWDDLPEVKPMKGFGSVDFSLLPKNKNMVNIA